MSSFIPSQNTIGQAFAIAGLVLVAPSAYFFRNYSRVLDYVQMFYVFALTYAATSGVFSLNLSYGFVSFMRSFLDSYCSADTFLCTYGYLISPAVVWLGVTLLMLIVIKIISCKKPNWTFQSFYNFWKGMYRWVMPGLVYASTTQIISSAQSANFSAAQISFDIAVSVALFCFTWMFVELIGHKCVQKEEENTWKKWCEFFSTFRIMSVIALAVVSMKISTMAQYFIYGPIVIYDIVFLIKYKFTFKVFQRVTFIIQEGILITIFSLFIFKSQYIYDNNLDLIGLALVIFLEIILFIPKLTQYCKGNDEDSELQQVNPEIQIDLPKKKSSSPILEEPSLSRVNIKDIGANNNNSSKIVPKRR